MSESAAQDYVKDTIWAIEYEQYRDSTGYGYRGIEHELHKKPPNSVLREMIADTRREINLLSAKLSTLSGLIDDED